MWHLLRLLSTIVALFLKPAQATLASTTARRQRIHGDPRSGAHGRGRGEGPMRRNPLLSPIPTPGRNSLLYFETGVRHRDAQRGAAVFPGRATDRSDERNFFELFDLY